MGNDRMPLQRTYQSYASGLRLYVFTTLSKSINDELVLGNGLRNCTSAPTLGKARSLNKLILFNDSDEFIDEFVDDSEYVDEEGFDESLVADFTNPILKVHLGFIDNNKPLQVDVILLSSSCSERNSTALALVAMRVWKKYNFFHSVAPDLKPQDWNAFFETVASRYHDNPYHNSEHAADVLLTALSLVELLSLQPLSMLQILTLFTAAVVHDIEHVALTNAFLIQSKHPLTLEFPDTTSPMERMHAKVGIQVLSEFPLNSSGSILDHMELKDRKEMLRLIPYLISFTDLSMQKDLLSAGRNQAQHSDSIQSAIILHAADLGSAVKDCVIHRKWANRINEELYRQGDLQREANLPISIGCDRTLPMSPVQVGFLTHVVRPVYVVLQDNFSINVEVFISNIDHNIEMWKALE